MKVNGGILSIDSIYRFDNDERWKKIEFEVFTNSVIYIKITDIYNQMAELDVSLLTVQPQKNKPTDESVKVVVNKRADKETKSISEKFVELQQFVRKGKYLLDFGKSVFDVDTELFPCSRMRIEIEVRPLNDIPDMLKNTETCSEDMQTKSGLPELIDNIEYGKMIRVDGFFPITSSIIKRFKFKISEPIFLVFLATFEKEISGGSMSLSITHVSEMKLTKSKDKTGMLPIYYSSETSDGITFLHQRLEPYLSGDLKLDSPGEYVVTLSGSHNAVLTKTLETNKFIPRCSKVSMYYQLTKISEIKNTYDEEFKSEIGEIDTSGNNCKNIKLDDVLSIQKYIEKQRGDNYMDISAYVLIPDPTTKKSIQFILRSLNKPSMSVVRVTVSLPEEIRLISSMKFHLRILQINDREKTDFILHKSLESHEKDMSFIIDDTDTRNYVVVIEFEDIDFNLLQTH